jgi:hypothetical protein
MGAQCGNHKVGQRLARGSASSLTPSKCCAQQTGMYMHRLEATVLLSTSRV